jgi:hypothetical protein
MHRQEMGMESQRNPKNNAATTDTVSHNDAVLGCLRGCSLVIAFALNSIHQY